MNIENFIDIEISPGKSQTNSDKLVQNLTKIEKGAEKTEKATKRNRDEFGRYVKQGTEGSTKLGASSDKTNQKIQSNNRKSQASFKATGHAAQNSAGIVERSSASALRSIVSYTVGVVGAGAALRALVTDYRDFEVGLVGVAKTTGLAGQDLDDFAKQIDEISTKIPVSTSELLELAQAAGQMGVTGSANLEKFSVTVAKLGRASDLAGEDAAKSLARILNVTGESIDSIDTLASVLVSLGNQVAATESEIALMTTEVARATSIFGISSAESAGLAAAMSSIGVQAALGGSSVGRAMRTISEAVLLGGDALDDFSQSMGLNSAELEKAWNEDKVAGLMMFLEALNSQGEMAAITLTDIGLGGQQAAKTLLPLANNIDIVATTLGIANKEVENATALDREFAATLETFDSQWTIFKGGVESASRAISSDFMPSMTEMLMGVNEFNQDGGIEMIADGASRLAKVVAVGGALYLGVSALTGLFTGVSVSANLAAGGITRVGLALNVALAALAGWEIGSFLSDNFAEARVAGMSFVVAMMNGFERLKAAGTTMWIGISGQFEIFKDDIITGYATILDKIASGLDSVGLDNLAKGYENFSANLKTGTTSAEDLKNEMELVQSQMEENITANNQFLTDMIKFEVTTANATDSTEELTDEQENLENQLEITNREIDHGTEALDDYSEATMDVLDGLAEQIFLLDKTDREQDLYNQLKEAGVEADSEAGKAIAVLNEAYHDQADAISEAEQAAKDYKKEQKELERDAEKSAKEVARQWLRVRDTFSDFFVDLVSNGNSAFDSLVDSFKAMLLKMIADFAGSKILELFGFGGSKFGVNAPSGILGALTGGGSSTGLSSVISGAGSIGSLGGLGGIAATGSQFLGGIMGTAVGTSATLVGPPTAAAAAGSGLAGGVSAAFAAIPVWGWAALGAAAIGQATKNPDGYTRSNAGFLLGDTSGLKRQDRLFGTEQFDSGLSVTGFNRRTNRNEAEDQINTFRSIDTAVNDLVELAGGTLDTTNALFHGLNEDGQDGSSGNFFGIGGKTTSLEGQIDHFASQLGEYVTGLEEGVLQQLADATGFNDIITVLEQVIISNEELANSNMVTATNLTDYGARMRAEINDKINSFDTDAYAAKQFVGDHGFNAERDLTDDVLNRAALTRQRLSDPVYVRGLWEKMDPARRPEDFRDMMTDGSHFTGLSRVPFDGYMAETHEGEKIQSEAEVKAEASANKDERRELFTLTKNMSEQIIKMKRQQDDWTQNGLYTVDTPPA